MSSYVFIIFFRKENQKFYIKSNPEHKHLSGNVIVKLNHNTNFPIVKNQKVLISEHLLDVSPENEGRLQLIVINGNSDKKENSVLKKISFDPNETKKVTVGRDKSAIVCLKDNGFSKIHSTFLFDANKKIWELRDGTDYKPSTNGTWIYAESSYEICDNMVIEVGTSKLKINLFENFQ